MLVLSRRTGEEIVIGDGIRITVVSMKGNQVRIGVTAPRSVAVDRQEVAERRVRDEDLPGAGDLGRLGICGLEPDIAMSPAAVA